ncbi:MAG: hypothetical protein AUK48_13410 [Oscillatoriales cyanobacterium CG2_30_44_21]|nr:MAG: hypothetical protein AUK48_13410 [Oscillatoriales cyanobacterium CG2_30_44_21]
MDSLEHLQDLTVVESERIDHFLVLQDPQGQQSVNLSQKNYILGRSPEADIILRSQSVSREHATLSAISINPLDYVFQISDGTSESGKSTNGLIINGDVRDSWVLMHGDEIIFSSNTLAIYRISPEPPYASGKMGIFLEWLYELAQRERKLGRFSIAEGYLNQVLAISQRLYGERQPQVANCLLEIATLNFSQNLFDKGEALFLEGIEILRKALGVGHPDVTNVIKELASIYSSQTMYEKAEFLLLQVLEIKQNIFNNEHPEVAVSFVDLGAICTSQKRYQLAKIYYRNALKIYKKVLKAGHPDILYVQKKLTSIKKKLRPKWLSPSLLIPASLIFLSGVIVYSFYAPRPDLTCVKVLTDGSTKSISGDECRRISK